MISAPEYFNFSRDILDGWAHRRPEGLALWCVDETTGQERQLTFAQVARQARQAAAFLYDAGIRPGDRVLIMMPRRPQWWIAMLGLIRLGAVPMPGTTMLTPRDIDYRLEVGQGRAVLTDAAGAAKVEGFGGLRIIAGGGEKESLPGWISFDAGLAQADAAFDPSPTRADDPALIYFTSGTTGQPKMVLHTQASYGLGHRLTGELWLDCRPGEVHWNLSDTGWGKAAWSSFYGPWHMGACIFATQAHGRFDPGATLRTLARYPINTWCAPPTALRLVVRHPLADFRAPHLRHCVSAGEPLNPEVIRAWKAATGLTIHEAYGQTETVVLVGNFRSHGIEVRPGSMGKPTPGFDLEVLDGDLQPTPVNREGQLAIRVDRARPLGLFREYWMNPEENARRFCGPWYLTGDVVRKDEQGYFWFIGRDDDVIKSAGYRIGPFEVESALIEHPAVLEAGVVGKPDAIRGQIVKAYVVLRPGHQPSEALGLELREHCKRVTAPYKHPREIEFVAQLPKTISGKIRRVELRDPAAKAAGEAEG